MTKIYPSDTQWGIAAQTEKSQLERLAQRLPRELQGKGHTVMEGGDGFAALLVFGGEADEDLARALVQLASPVFLMDFDDEAPLLLRLDRKKGRIADDRLKQFPSEFLKERGITAPGYDSAPSSLLAVGLVEDVSLKKAMAVAGEGEGELLEHPRGVLLVGPATDVGIDIARKYKQRLYLINRDPGDNSFGCLIREPDGKWTTYSPTRPNVNYPAVANVLGETTLAGILRALAIPADTLGL